MADAGLFVDWSAQPASRHAGGDLLEYGTVAILLGDSGVSPHEEYA